MISKINKKLPLEFKIFTPKKLFKNDEDKENCINNIYNSFNNGKINNAEKNIKLYLSKIKKLNDTEINTIFDKYNFHNFKSNIQELHNSIKEKDISNKIFSLYLKNNDFNRIEPLLKTLNEKEKKIMKFDKIFAKSFINN